jgi:hypothetical protein
VTEQGIDSDAGRPASLSAIAPGPDVVVDPEGTLVEGPATANILRALSDGCNGVLAEAPPRRIRTGHVTPSLTKNRALR